MRQSLSEKLHLKTVKNIVAGTFRAMLRDAQIDGVIKRSRLQTYHTKLVARH